MHATGDGRMQQQQQQQLLRLLPAAAAIFGGLCRLVGWRSKKCNHRKLPVTTDEKKNLMVQRDAVALAETAASKEKEQKKRMVLRGG